MAAAAILRVAARERVREARQNRNRRRCSVSWSGQRPRSSDAINRIDAVSAAALRHKECVVENRQAPEIVVFPWLVCLREANLCDFEIADLIDVRRYRRRLMWNQQFGAG